MSTISSPFVGFADSRSVLSKTCGDAEDPQIFRHNVRRFVEEELAPHAENLVAITGAVTLDQVPGGPRMEVEALGPDGRVVERLDAVSTALAETSGLTLLIPRPSAGAVWVRAAGLGQALLP